MADAIGFQDDVHEIQSCEKKKTSVGRAGELIDEQANKLADDWCVASWFLRASEWSGY